MLRKVEIILLLSWVCFSIITANTDLVLDDGSGDDIAGSDESLNPDIEAGSGLGPDDEDTSDAWGSGVGPEDDEDMQHFKSEEAEHKPHHFASNEKIAVGFPSTTSSDHVIDQETIEPSPVTTTSGPSWVIPSTAPRTSPATTAEDPRILSTTAGTPKRENLDPFIKPGILAAVIGGAVVGLLASILIVMFVVYRMRKKDEGSYVLDEPKTPSNYPYQKAPAKEIYA